MNNSVLCHWLLPKVITSTQNTDLINGWMNRVSLPEEQNTSEITRISHITPKYDACYPCILWVPNIHAVLYS